jgi:beta-glucanase (GH16 family)
MKSLGYWVFNLSLFLLFWASAHGQAVYDPKDSIPTGYGLVWADEFSKDGLPDKANWSYDTHANKGGWYNNEKQYYASRRLENSRVRNGVLEITARHEALKNKSDWGGQDYSSARLITQGKREFTYGFFDIRAKMPCGLGTWPAIWTLGANGTWPQQGEIDILEHMGRTSTVVQSAIHTKSGHGGKAPVKNFDLPEACQSFNHYQLLWTPEQLEFFVNGNSYHVYKNEGTGPDQWPFDRAQFLLLNLAMGGVLGGEIDNKDLPRTFYVDYVRVYQKPKAN